MVSGIWRRVRSLFGGTADDAPDQPSEPARRSFYAYDQPPDQQRPVAPAAAPPVPARPPEPLEGVDRQAERLSERLGEDEALRRGLTDEEFAPLLTWATDQIEALRASCAGLQPAESAERFGAGRDQILGLLQTIGVAVGRRGSAPESLALGRLQLLDTYIEPPLFEGQRREVARGRVEMLLTEPSDQLLQLAGPELARRIVQALE